MVGLLIVQSDLKRLIASCSLVHMGGSLVGWWLSSWLLHLALCVVVVCYCLAATGLFGITGSISESAGCRVLAVVAWYAAADSLVISFLLAANAGFPVSSLAIAEFGEILGVSAVGVTCITLVGASGIQLGVGLLVWVLGVSGRCPASLAGTSCGVLVELAGVAGIQVLALG